MIQPSEHNKQTVESYFGFQQPPFGVTPDPRFFYTNRAYSEALAEVAHGITAKKGLMLVTGEVGTGKTILLRKIMRDLGTTVKFIFLSSSHDMSDRVLDVVSNNLGLSRKKSRVETSEELTQYLLQRNTDGQVVTLLVDEAQNTSDRGFETLCALSNLETDDEKLLQIVLVGQPELMSKLNQPALRQIKQRVAIQHTISGLQTKSELEDYVHHRLDVVGYNGPEIFTQEALDAVWEYSGGTPRIVNILCDNSLTLACEAGMKNVSGDVATKAAGKFHLNRVAQLPTFADTGTTAIGTVTDVGITAEGSGADVSNGNGIDRPAISPLSSDAASSGSQGSSRSRELPSDAMKEAARFPASSQQADFVKSEEQSARDGKFTGVIGSLRGVSQSRSRLGLRWKIAVVFSAATLIFSAVLMGAVYRLSERTLRAQVDKRILAVAMNLSDASAGYMLRNDRLALNTLLRKYTFLEGLAYAFIRDNGGAITAQTLGTLPPELHQTLAADSERVPSRRELSVQGNPIYETSVPLLDGQIGVVHVGFWGDAVDNEIRRAILPVIAVVGIIPLVGVGLSFVLAQWIAGPIIRLTKVAERIVEGDLETSGEFPTSRDEIGDLARSLERMRTSLRAAMSRLQRELG